MIRHDELQESFNLQTNGARVSQIKLSTELPTVTIVDVQENRVVEAVKFTGLYLVLPLAIMALITLGYMLASWEHMVCFTGADKEGFGGGYVTRKMIDEFGLSTMHDMKGASCLFLAVPIVTFLTLYYSGMANPKHGKVGLALAIVLYQVWCSAWSYFGDHYHEMVHEDMPEEGTMPGEGKITWWQKARACNTIDLVFAKNNLLCLALIFVVYLFYSATAVSYKPLLGLFLIATVICKLNAGWKFQQFAEDKNPDSLWQAMFFHTLWHIGGAMCTHFCVYELMTTGLNFATSDSEEDEDEENEAERIL